MSEHGSSLDAHRSLPPEPVVDGLVSTIIPVFNRGAMLREAVASVIAQTWRPIEIIIVDDGSTDDTRQVAATLQGAHPEEIRVFDKPNGGPGAARQFGLERARGEFIQFLDSDDFLLPRKFELQVTGLRADTEADISYCVSFAITNGQREGVPTHRTGERFRHLFPALLEHRIWPTMTPLYRRSSIPRIGAWPRKRQLEDWEYDAQAGAAGVKLHYEATNLAETRNHDGDRLCRGWLTQDAALADMASAYRAVCAHAQRAGVDAKGPEMKRFARSLFWMARVAAGRGLGEDARLLLGAAKRIATERVWELDAFEGLAQVIGWQRASRLAERLVGAL